ncbi:MAG TPA: VWA domain-containing protein [Candidatus Acidoferrales bacterium]
MDLRLTWKRAILAGLVIGTMLVPAGNLHALASAAQSQQGQQPPPKQEKPQDEFAITVDVPLVNVDVVVTDNRGGFVTGLKKENFRILEDGKPQSITNFAPTDAPITIVMLMEFSKLGYDYFAYQGREWAYYFLNYLGKEDWVALVTYDLKTRIENDFTKNKAEIQGTIARMYFPGFSEANLFDAVVETLERLEDVKGKKAILIIASGFDTFSKNTLDDAIKKVRATDTTIFAVGAGKDLMEYLDRQGALGNIGRVNYYQAQNQLSAFARLTGGRAWFPEFQGQLPNIFRDVAAHMRNQYSLGYTPANRTRDGKFRKIKVQLVDAEGKPLVITDQNGKKVKYVIYAREGYPAQRGAIGDN